MGLFGVICEELSRLGLQYVLFDALGAHSGLSQLDNVIEVVPDMSKTVNVERLVQNIAKQPRYICGCQFGSYRRQFGSRISG